MSVAEPGTSEDLATVLDAAADTPTLTKRNSAPGKTRRDSFYVRQLGSDENEVTIKYHTKAPDQPESLKRIKYRDVLKHLEALLEYVAQSTRIVSIRSLAINISMILPYLSSWSTYQLCVLLQCVKK